MIVNFSIQNFGCIKDKQTLSFEAGKTEHLEDYYINKTVTGQRLLKLALIYGANASGKSTVLRALELLKKLVDDPKEKKTDELDFQPFLFDHNTPNENTILTIEFIQNGIKYYYEVEFCRKAIIKESLDKFYPKKSNVYKRTTNLERQFTEVLFGNTIKIDKTFEKALESNTLWNNTVLGGYLKTNIEFKELKDVTDWFVLLLPIMRSHFDISTLISYTIADSEKLKNNIVEILKQADFNISDISLQKKDNYKDFYKKLTKGEISAYDIKLEHTIQQKKYTLPFQLESEGTKRFYGFAGLLTLLLKESVVLPIDELEASLHPDLYLHFLLAFLANSNSSQLIATTHNRELLNNKDLFRDDAIWITDKDETCSTKLYSLYDFDSSVIRDTTNRLNAYKSGKLGGVPNLGDYYIQTQ